MADVKIKEVRALIEKLRPEWPREHTATLRANIAWKLATETLPAVLDALEAASLEQACPAGLSRRRREGGMKLVVLESPYAGNPETVERNLAYLRAAMRDSLFRGEAPYASHGLYTQPGVLDDAIPSQRALGIEAGLAWGAKADATVVYADYGLTPGMLTGIERAKKEGRLVEVRWLYERSEKT